MKPNHNPFLRSVALAALGLAPISTPLLYAGNTWTGGGASTNWTDANNWGGSAPTFGTLTFTTGGTQGTTSVLNGNFTATSNTNMSQLFWTGSSAWTLNNSGSTTLSLFDNGGTQAKIENQSLGRVTINAPIVFAATSGAAWGEISAVNGDITFGSTGTVTMNGSILQELRFLGTNSRTVTVGSIINLGTRKLVLGDSGAPSTNITVALNNANVYSGNTEINGGTVGVGNATALGTSTVYIGSGATTFGNTNAALSISNSSLSVTNNFVTNKADQSGSAGTGTRTISSTYGSGTSTLSGTIAINGGLILDTASGGTLTLSGIISNGTDSGVVLRSLTKVGAGTLTLSGANSYNGGTSINVGTLQLGSGSTTGTLSTSSAISIASGANLTFNRSNAVTQGTDFSTAAITGAGSITQSGSNTLTLNAANTYSGGTTLTAGTLTATSALFAATQQPLGTGQLNLNAGTINLLTGGATGSGAGNTTAETVTFGNNTVVGGTTTISVNRTTASTASTSKTIVFGVLSIGANTLNVTGGNTYGLQFGATTLTGNATFNPTSAPLTITGAIGDGGGGFGFTKNGSGVLTITGAGTYTGATYLGGVAGTGATAGTLTVSGAAGSIASSSSYTINGSGSQLNLDYSGGAGPATLDRLNNGGTVTLNLGGELRFTNATNATNTSETFGTLTLGTGAGIVTVNQGGSSGAVNAITASGFSRGSNFATGLVRGANLGLQNNTNRSEVRLTSTAGLTQVGTSTSTTGLAGITKNLTIVPYLLGDTSSATVGKNFVTYDATSGFRALDQAEASLVTAGATGDNVKSVAGANSVTGAKVFNSLLVGAGTASNTPATAASTVTGNNNTLTLTSGALANVATGGSGSSTVTGFSSIIFGTTGANEAIITNANTSATLTIDSPINTSAAGGGLTKAGGGTVALTQANLYTGQTTINQGTLQIGNGGTTGDLGNSSALGFNGGGLSLNRTNNLSFSGPVSVNTTAPVSFSSTGNLVLTGNVSNSASVAAFSTASALSVTSTASTNGRLIIAPTGTNSVTLNTSNINVVSVGANATLELGGNGINAPLTISSNTIVSTVNGVGVGGNAGSLVVNSGSWTLGDFSANNAAGQLLNATYLGGTSTYRGARYTANGSTINVNGGTMLITNANTTVSNANRFALGNSGAANTSTFNVQSGLVDIAQGAAAAQIGGDVALNATVAGNGLFNQSGGTVQIGRTTSAGGGLGGAATNSNLTIGVFGTGTATQADAYTLTGGTLLVNGTILTSGTSSVGSFVNFNFNGGTLTAGGYNATGIGSNAAATATTGQATVSNNIGTLVNNGGTLAPGGNALAFTTTNGVTSITQTPVSGRTAITGGYTQQASGSLALNLGGTTASTVFQDAANAGRSSNVTVSGATALNGNLLVNLINGSGGTPFVPTNANTFTVLTSTGTLSGNFTNYQTAKSGVTNLIASGTGAFNATVTTGAGGTVSLGNFTAGNTYTGATGSAWETAAAANWSVYDPGSNGAAPSGAIAQFADGIGTGTGDNAVTLNSMRNVQGIQFASALAGHNYTINGTGPIILDNTGGGAAATIADSSASGNANAINVPMTLNSNLAVSVTNSGNTLTLGGAIGEATALKTLTKNGAGTLILSGANTYSGATTVSVGALLANNTTGSATGTGTVSVSSGAILGGSGSISGATTLTTATLAPGSATATAGTLTFGAGLALNSTSIFEWDMQQAASTDPGADTANAGTYDNVVLNGSANSLTGSGAIFKIVLGSGKSFADAFWDTNKTWNNVFSGSGVGTSLASIFSTFNANGTNLTGGLVTGEGTFTFNGSTTLNWTAVPEPTSALAGLLIAAGLLRRRRSA